MIDFKPTWLYLKQHNKTGLKYFGKTIRNPDEYLGSGIYWTNHLALHGDDVSTIWKQLFTTKKEINEFALKYSRDNNVVESKEYANLKPEDGLMGGDTGLTAEGLEKIRLSSKSRKHSEETKQRIKEARAHQKNLRTGQKHSPDTISKIKAARALQKNVRGIIRE